MLNYNPEGLVLKSVPWPEDFMEVNPFGDHGRSCGAGWAWLTRRGSWAPWSLAQCSSVLRSQVWREVLLSPLIHNHPGTPGQDQTVCVVCYPYSNVSSMQAGILFNFPL